MTRYAANKNKTCSMVSVTTKMFLKYETYSLVENRGSKSFFTHWLAFSTYLLYQHRPIFNLIFLCLKNYGGLCINEQGHIYGMPWQAVRLITRVQGGKSKISCLIQHDRDDQPLDELKTLQVHPKCDTSVSKLVHLG